MQHPAPIITDGIIIGIQPYSEADLIVRLISDTHGKLSLFARHARKSKKRFGTQLDLLEKGKFTFKPGRGSLFQLQDFSPYSPFKAIRADLLKITFASTLCECVDFLVVEASESDSKLLSFIDSALFKIDTSLNQETTLLEFKNSIQQLLSLTGFFSEKEFGNGRVQDLFALLDCLESIAERPLKSKGALSSLLASPPLATNP